MNTIPANSLRASPVLFISTFHDLTLGHVIQNNVVKRLFLPYHKKRSLLFQAKNEFGEQLEILEGDNTFNTQLFTLWTTTIPVSQSLMIPLDLQMFSLKTRRVLEVVKRIPFGKTMTYGEVAQKAGIPGGARFVGNVMARNPFPPIIPCHRVISRSPKNGGYAFGLKLKHALLQKEQKGIPLPLDLFP